MVRNVPISSSHLGDVSPSVVSDTSSVSHRRPAKQPDAHCVSADGCGRGCGIGDSSCACLLDEDGGYGYLQHAARNLAQKKKTPDITRLHLIGRQLGQSKPPICSSIWSFIFVILYFCQITKLKREKKICCWLLCQQTSPATPPVELVVMPTDKPWYYITRTGCYRDLDGLGVDALAHLRPSVVHQHRAILEDVDPCCSLATKHTDTNIL